MPTRYEVRIWRNREERRLLRSVVTFQQLENLSGLSAGFVAPRSLRANIKTMSMPSPPDDDALDQVEAWFKATPDHGRRLRKCVRDALDEVIDTSRTGRFNPAQLSAQEKTYIGTKVEILIRAAFELAYPGRKHKDYVIAGHEVDCKWSRKFGGWSIPTEQQGHLCLLVHADDETNQIAVGLMRTLPEYLNAGENKDKKKTIQASYRDTHIRWLIPLSDSLPENFLLHLPTDDRKAILSKKGGVARAYELYRRCEGIVISRHVMASVGQQHDDSRRFRGGKGGVRESLLADSYEVLNGSWKRDRVRSVELGGPVLAMGESICLHQDGLSVQRAEARRGQRVGTHRKRPKQDSLPLLNN